MIKLVSATFRDPVKLPGSNIDTTSYVNLVDGKLRGDPAEMIFDDGLVRITATKKDRVFERLVPWTNVVDMEAVSIVERIAEQDSKPGRKARGGP